jgi:hypothetical protein
LVHGGIAVFLGMKTFGLAMLIGNLAFVYPETVRAVVAWLGSWGRSKLHRPADHELSHGGKHFARGAA